MTLQDRQGRIDELFAEAIDVPSSHRDSFLDDACANDPPEIRANVDKLLAVDAIAQTVLPVFRAPQ